MPEPDNTSVDNTAWNTVRATLAGGDQTRAQMLESFQSPEALFEKLNAKPPEAPEYDWRKAIAGEDADGLKALERFPDLPTYGKAFNDTRKALHESGRVRIPGEGATPEQITEFAKAFGVAEKPDAYEIKAEAPKGYEVSDSDKNIMGRLQTTLHEAIAKGARAPELMNVATQFYLNEAAQARTAAGDRAAEMAVESEEQLKTLWGGNYDDNVKYAVAGAKQFFVPSDPSKGDQEFNDFLDLQLSSGHALGDHPMFLRMFSSVGRQFAEDPFFQKMKGDNQGFDPEKRKAEIMAMRYTNPKEYARLSADGGELDKINAGLSRRTEQGPAR